MKDLREYSQKYQIAFLLAMTVCGGVVGCIYETIFYYFNDGRFVKRGAQFGPWIDIYMLGTLMIYFLTRKYKDNLLKVFVISGISCGILELIVGFLIDHFLGLRPWDYRYEILSWGHINGYVCIRSVLIFAIGGVSLWKIVLPLLQKMADSMSEKTFLTIWYVLGGLLLADLFWNDVLCYMFPALTSASDIFTAMGIQG